MNRSHFFKVFDGAWKKAVDRPNHAIAGFRKCGLVPFNPDHVAYDKLIVPASTSTLRSLQPTNESEKVGMSRIFQLFEDTMTDELVTLFRHR